MSTFATYLLEVNWNGDGSTWVNETQHLISIECRRGRDYASQLTGRATPGALVATLQNVAGRFASFNASGALYGNLLPARKVRWRTTAPSAATLWQGFLEAIEPSPGGREDLPTVTLRAAGPLRRIEGKKASTQVYTAIETGTAVGHVLDDAAWPAGDRTIDTGQVQMSRWKADGDSALSHLREIENTEQGYIGESRDGKIVYEDVHHRLKTPHYLSQVTFSDASGAALPYEEIAQADAWLEIYNLVRASVTTWTVQALGVLWTLTGESPEIKAGQVLKFWAGYPNPDSPDEGDHVNAWTTPVASTDYLANAQADGLGANLTASVSVAVSKFANAMLMTFTNNGAVTAYLTLVQARGTAVFKNDPIRREVEDANSQTKYGVRTFPLPGEFYPTTTRAQEFVEYILSRYKDPLPILAMTFQANQSAAHMAEALARDVSDRITVRADDTSAAGAQLGINREFSVEAITHRYNLAGHWVTYELSDAFGGVSGYWVLEVSTLGESTRLNV